MIPIAVHFVLFAIVCLLYLHLSMKWSQVYRRVEKVFPGPKLLPIIGNGHLFFSYQDAFDKLMNLATIYDRFYRIFIGNTIFILIFSPRDTEVILTSNLKLEKASVYQFLYPWIGTGLLTSGGEKWKSRRRIITPAFHFNVLESYLDLFNANGLLLCQKLSERIGKGPFDVHQLIKLYALDNICETAMKIKANALTNSESAYVRAIREVAGVVTSRSFNFLLYNDFIFNFSKEGQKQRKALKVIHDTTKSIIRERRAELTKAQNNIKKEDDSGVYEKKRMVFLDILLSSTEGSSLSDEDICEEVNTFLFEGHDTVSSGISFTLYALATNPKIQEAAYQEQLDIFGDSDRLPTSADLQNMRYLDMILKESQRLYPSVPFIGRQIHEDVKLDDGYVLPKGVEVTLFIARLHRDPKVWPNPDTFNPDNFLPEAMASRSPFSYVPFSAGARNCIGQRFAILEMKSCISKILRQFKLKPSPNPEDAIQIYAELVLVSRNGVKIQVERR